MFNEGRLHMHMPSEKHRKNTQDDFPHFVKNTYVSRNITFKHLPGLSPIISTLFGLLHFTNHPYFSPFSIYPARTISPEAHKGKPDLEDRTM